MFERGVPLCIWIKGNNIALQLFNKENGLDAILDRSLSLDENINRVLDKLKGFRSQMYKENPELIIGVLFDHPDRIPTRLTKLQFYTK
ncbi:hypothetical protein A6V25_32545 [Nostoc sp. ATCC 53789]|nr:hypothetical protein A6V25_32545 [Nostoc sp. ATCC 53789]